MISHQCLSVACLFLLSSFAHADILAGYDFDTGVGDGEDVSTPEANVQGANVTASDFGTGIGLTTSYDSTLASDDILDAEGNPFGTANRFAFGGTGADFGFDDVNDTDDLSGAIQNNDYVVFSVTSDNGYELNLSSLAFRVYIEQLANSAERWALFSSIDGFSSGSEIATGQTTNVGTWDGASNNIVVDLSDARFQAVGEAVSFRIYVYGGGESTNSITLFDKVLLNGAAAKKAILVGYDFDGDASDPSVATTVADQIAASQLTSPMAISYVATVGDNSGVAADGEVFGSADTLGCVGIGVDDATTASFANAVANDHYVTFTVTPDEGKGFRLTQLSFKASKRATTSVDEYALADAAGNMIGSPAMITNVVGLTGVFDGVSVDLTGTPYEFISEATEFRIYAWGRGTANTASTLAVIDKVALYGDISNNSGRNSHFWVTLKPQAGTASGADTDLVLENGYRSVDLSSPDLSCTRVDVGSNWEYQIKWTGNSLVGGPEAEALEFSVVVEAFVGADYVYAVNDATVTSLGSVSTPTDLNNNWGVNSDMDVDAGQSIRMTLQDFTVGGANLEANGLTLEDDNYETVSLIEPNGGHSHKLIFGVGTNLATADFNVPSTTRELSGDSFSVTGAGSYYAASREWAIDQVTLRFVVRNPALTEEDPDNLYADIEGGHTYGSTPYEPTTPEKLANAFPEFSWDRVPRTMLIRKASESFTAEEAERVAKRYDLVVLEKANGQIGGYWDKAASLKAYNPDIKTVFYWNSRIFYGHQNVDDGIDYRWDEFIDPVFTIRNGLDTYQRDNPDFVDWWVRVCHKIMGLVDGYAADGVTPLQDFVNWEHGSPIDGYFIDKTGVPISMLQPLYEGSEDWHFCMNNNGPNRDRIAYLDGTYREGWSGGFDPATVAQAIALAQESGRNQKLTTLRNPTGSIASKREMEDSVDHVLGIYLAYADEYAYFYHQQTVDATAADWQWITDYYDQFNRPLGQPLGEATKDIYIYTRSYEHCDLYLDLETDSGGNLARIMWKNDIGAPALAGSGASSTDNTYTLTGSGNISDTADNFFFLSDLHYGNGEVLARIDTLSASDPTAKAGVMFRERNDLVTTDLNHAELYTAAYSNGTILESGARTVAVVRKPNGQMQMVYRTTTGGAMDGIASVNPGPYAKLTRSGDTFTGYCSPDGVTWTEIGQVTLMGMAEKIEMGMAVASGNSNSPILATATFSEFARVESAPVADAQSVTLDEDTSVAITLTGSDSIGTTSLTYTLTSQSANGTLSGTAPNLIYTPNANYFGTDSFAFIVNDGFADSEAATVSITVNQVEDLPYSGAQPALAVIGFDNVYTSSLADASYDPDGDILSYSVLSGPAWLTVASDGALSGTPASSDQGVNSWMIDVSDGNGNTATFTLEIAVVDSVLIGYDFDAGAIDMSAATVVPANVSASQLTSPMAIAWVTTAGDNSGVDAAGVEFGSTNTLGGVGISVSNAVTDSFADAVANDNYMTFTVTPDEGKILQLYGITFKAAKKATTSVDEYAVTDGAGNLIGTTATITDVVDLTGTYDDVSVSLLGTAYEFITDATEFRIYAWGRGTSNTSSTLAAIDKLTLHGEVTESIVDYRHTAGSAVPDATADGVSSSASLDGTGLYGGIATTIDQYSVTVGNGLGLNEDQSLDHYMAYTVVSETAITYSSLQITPYAKTTTRDYRLSYIINGGTEVFISEWSDSPDIANAETLLFDFADFATAESVEFRVYWGGTASNMSLGRAYVDDFILLGSVSEMLVGYDFDAGASDPSAATLVAANVTASQMVSPMSVGIVSTVGDNTGLDACDLEFGSPSILGCLGISVTAAITTSFTDAVAGDDYVTFTVAPQAGAELDLSLITFLATKKATISVDEYAVTDGSGNLIGAPVIITNVVGLTGVYDGVIVDLSSYASVAEATEFRIYAWGRGTTNPSNSLAAIDKITLYGTVK